MDPRDFLVLVIRPTLEYLEAGGTAAERILLATAVHESGGLRYLKQGGDGPALGPYQIEPATHDDLWVNWLAFRGSLAERIKPLLSGWPDRTRQLVGNLNYSTAIARAIYLRVPESLPAADDIEGQARYWKRHYNTPAGRGTVEAFIESWNRWMT